VVKSILLTGHTGFLGSVIYKELKKSFHVLTAGRDASCDYNLDFSTWDGALELKHSIDTIVHVAGLAHNKAKSNEELIAVNATSVEHLLTLAVKNKIETFSFNSSTAVYGQTYDVNIRENSSLRGKSNFATSKREAEKVIESFNLGSKLILRLPLVLGPNPPGNLGRLLKSISSGSHIYLQGNHAQKSVVFASDVANFISHWLLQPTRDSGTVNLCNQTAPAFNWIENAIAETVSHSFRFRVPIKFLWATLNWIKAKLNISFPLVGKLFYPLTFSDQLAREKYGYTSKPLNQTSFTNELNSNS
jgi:nucleoside-diphosphate-sugar epimerase